MWHIKETSEIYQEATGLVLDAIQFGEGKPNGIDGETILGHSFFQVKEWLR